MGDEIRISAEMTAPLYRPASSHTASILAAPTGRLGLPRTKQETRWFASSTATTASACSGADGASDPARNFFAYTKLLSVGFAPTSGSCPK